MPRPDSTYKEMASLLSREVKDKNLGRVLRNSKKTASSSYWEQVDLTSMQRCPSMHFRSIVVPCYVETFTLCVTVLET